VGFFTFIDSMIDWKGRISMSKESLFIAFISIILLFSLGISSEAISSDEEEIKAVLASYEEAWNKKDAGGVIAVYHQDAKVMTGREKRIVSKDEYLDILPERFKLGSMKLGKPSIKIKGDNAKVRVKMKLSGSHRTTRTTFSMTRESDKWLITKQTY
jgi:ketosteroid isomerase-like protein